MANEAEFINGLIVKAPNENAPDYVKAKLSIKREELIAWLQARTGDWINADLKVSQNGKWYAAVDNWKPNQEGSTSSSGNREQREPKRETVPAADFADDDVQF